MPDVVAFRLVAPMMAFGDLAVGERRTVFSRPSHSGMTGLLAASLGMSREAAGHEELSGKFLLVLREDRSGHPLTDYHTAQTPPQRRGQRFATRRDELSGPRDGLKTVLSRRDYLTGSAWTVVLWPSGRADDGDPRRWAAALAAPQFAPYAGRRSCPLSAPLAPRLFTGVESVAEVLRRWDGETREEAALLGLPCDGRYLYGDAALLTVMPHGAERLEQRRDRLLSRSRWQFDLREEVVVRLPEGPESLAEGAP